MKKNKQYKAKKQVTRNTKRAINAKKRIQNRKIQQNIVETIYEHGPSLAVEYGKDGKVKNWNSWSAKKHTKPTQECNESRSANKLAKENKKERIKQILQSMNYDPTIKYSRKEKKKFTRAIKAKLFEKPKIQIKTKEQYITQFKAERIAKKQRLDALPHINDLLVTLPKIKGKQRAKSAAEMVEKEQGNNRKFTYVVNRVREEDMEARKQGRPFRTYDFLTDYFNANTVKEAEKKIKSISKKYKEDTSFTGITLKDPEGENMTTYYTLDKLDKIAA